MRLKHLLWTLGVLCLIAGGLLAVNTAYTQGDGEQGPPEAHAAIQEYAGPETCLMCHPGEGQEVAASVHYTNWGEAPLVEGWEDGKMAGMMNTF